MSDSTPPIDARLLEVALEHCSEGHFELYGQSLLAAVLGVEFVPTGGMHDGGHDGFLEPTLSSKSKPDSFIQISKQQDVKRKVCDTVKRLRYSGRAPSQVTLLTSRAVPHVDREEEQLAEELGLSIRIRERRWIIANGNSSTGAKSAFYAHLAQDVAFLSEFGATKIASTLGDGVARTAYVFLAQEVERRRGNTELLEAVTDSLILWALEGTDPDKKIFRSREEISKKILDVFRPQRSFCLAY